MQCDVGQAQVIVAIDEAGICFDGSSELNSGFLILALLRVVLSTGEVAFLGDLGTTAAT
ncbi:MAG: hypothetical protein WCF74_05205 [Candidatus Sulfotelmatobacter sp.]